MSIGQIYPDAGVNPLKDQVGQLPKQQGKTDGPKETLESGGDRVELSDTAKLFQEVNKYKKELDTVPSPNEGRIAELKKSVADGTLVSQKTLAETAQRLADQLFA